MKKYYPFLAFWALDVVLLFLATSLLPNNYVLGTFRMSKFSSALFAGFVWTLIVWFSEPLTKKLKLKLEGQTKQMLFYLASNFIALWVVGHLAFFTGFGVTSFIWVFVLAFFANFFQYMLWKFGKLKM